MPEAQIYKKAKFNLGAQLTTSSIWGPKSGSIDTYS